MRVCKVMCHSELIQKRCFAVDAISGTLTLSSISLHAPDAHTVAIVVGCNYIISDLCKWSNEVTVYGVVFNFYPFFAAYYEYILRIHILLDHILCYGVNFLSH